MSVKTLININNKYDRVIVLIDMDCFYCQVEECLNPTLVGKPIAVVQYNAWKGGGIIAVNYPARKKGVTRHMRGDQAKEVCPNIELVQVPNVREKADLTKYRDAGKAVANVLQTFTNLLERASVDEAYLDITENVLNRIQEMNDGDYTLEPEKLLNCYALGYEFIGNFIENISASASSASSQSQSQSSSGDNNNNLSLNDNDFEISDEERNMYRKSDIKLLIGASIVNEIRAAVKEQTGYECSAGIAHNKILAKLVCGINKPNKQTVLPLKYVQTLLSTLPIQRIKGLGGKFGEEVCESLKIKSVGELCNFGKDELQKLFDEKHGSWLHLLGQGIDLDAITPRIISKSIGCCKKFPGRTAIVPLSLLTHWLTELSSEILERIEQDEAENMRRPKQMIVSYTQWINRQDVSSSRCTPPNYQIPTDCNQMATDAMEIIKRNTIQFLRVNDPNKLNNSIKFLGLSVTKFECLPTTGIIGNNNNNPSDDKHSIKSMFINQMAKQKEFNNVWIDKSDEIEKSNEIEKMINEEINDVMHKTDVKEDEKIYQIEAITAESKPKMDNPLLKSSTNSDADSSELTIHEELQPQQNEIKSFFMELQEERKRKIDSETSNDSCDMKFNPIGQNNDDQMIGNNSSMQNLRESTKAECTETITDYRQMYAEFHPLAQPETLQLDDFYERCNECNKKILKINMQSHSDSHFAYRLSQEQRTEFRNQLKNRSTTKTTSSAATSPIKKRLKSSLSVQFNGKILDSYFKKSTDNCSLSISNPTPFSSTLDSPSVLQLSSNLPAGDECCPSAINNQPRRQSFESSHHQVIAKEMCDECNSLIAMEFMQEHTDLHVAQKINLELNPELQNYCGSSPAAVTTSDGRLITNNRRVATNGQIKTAACTNKLNHQKKVGKIKSIASFFKSQNN